jgi:flagellar hook-associated protein 2
MSNTISTGSSLLSNLLSSSTLPTVGGLTSTTTSSPDLAVAGIASGLDWQTIVQELGEAEAAPETQWEGEQSNINAENSAFQTIAKDLGALQTDIQALQNSSLYQSASVQSSNSDTATGTTTTGAALGTYTFDISQLATAAQLNGAGNISQAISPSGNLSDVTVGTAGFSTPITAGTFTVDGQQVTVTTTESMQDLFNAIATATNNEVTASYNSSTDKITLASSNNSQIVLGSAADTSNFLQVAQLYNNGIDSVTSTSALGHVQLGVTMTNADLATAVTDGGNGQGEFTINGVAINYDASTDSIQDVLNQINSSTAGVTATYDSIDNRFVLTNNTTGDVGISAQDVTGNFLAATGLSSGTLQSGQNLLYTLANGTQAPGSGAQQLVSESNTITPASSSIAGLSVTALQTGTVTMSVTSDTSAVSSAVQQFVTDYNTLQNYISSQQVVTTSSSGTVTPSPLTADETTNRLVSDLRSLVTAAVPSLSGDMVSMLSDLGIETNGQDNTLSVDTSTLDNAVAANLDNVETLFNDPTNGIATQLNNYITNAIGSSGTVTNQEASLTEQSDNITTQITNLNTQITSNEAQWTSEFEAMEQAESQTNQELTYLSEQVTNGNL